MCKLTDMGLSIYKVRFLSSNTCHIILISLQLQYMIISYYLNPDFIKIARKLQNFGAAETRIAGGIKEE